MHRSFFVIFAAFIKNLVMKKFLFLIVLFFFAWDGFAQTDCPSFADANGYTYKTVLLGQQCWMAENMRATTARDGSGIQLGGSKSSIVPYRYCPNGKMSNVATYAYLYNWEAAKVVCPNGWHLPSDAEWTQLTDYVSSQNQYVCGDDKAHNAKSLSAMTGWKKCSQPCTVGHILADNNATGFSALPAGGFYNDSYDYFGKGTFFWSSTEYSEERAYKRYIDYDEVKMVRYDYYKYGAGAVRCVQD